MKKLLLLFLTLICTLVSCTPGNSTNLNQKVHIIGDKCYKIKEKIMYANGVGADFILTDGTKLECSAGTYIIVTGICPICEGSNLNVR